MVVVTACPLVGLITCVLLAATIHHDESTRTHCGVANFWPSVSASVKNEPEQFIWRLAVSLHNVVTMSDSLLMYHNLCHHIQSTTFHLVMARLCALFKSCSSVGLFVLTFVGSTENFELHKAGFVMWILTGALSMVIFDWLWISGKSRVVRRQSFATQWLFGFTTSYFVFLFLAGWAYYWHNTYCTPYVYSLFGMCEFLVIVSYVFGCGWGHHVAFESSKMRFVLQVHYPNELIV